MATFRILHKMLRCGIVSEPQPASDDDRAEFARLHDELRQVFGRAPVIRHVDAGSCNGCELEIHALNGPHYNIEGLGIRFAASPRHADVLLVTGPVSAHLETALRRSYDATPDPKWVIAMGDCACDGGLFGPSYASRGRVANVIPVDVELRGCPPGPLALLRAIRDVVRRPPVGSSRV